MVRESKGSGGQYGKTFPGKIELKSYKGNGIRLAGTRKETMGEHFLGLFGGGQLLGKGGGVPAVDRSNSKVFPLS